MLPLLVQFALWELLAALYMMTWRAEGSYGEKQSEMYFGPKPLRDS